MLPHTGIPAQALSREAGIELGPGPAQAVPVPPFQSNDPLHGLTLERILTELVAERGWRELAERVPIRCFMFDPTIKSSLIFLRRNPWARTKIEQIYVAWKAPR
jgi:uncharacterized protein (DUF2132 family)